MSQSNFAMDATAQWLLQRETSADPPSESGSSAAVLVTGKLGRAIGKLAGDTGFRSLLTRALDLAREQASGLESVRVGADGSVEGLDGLPSGELDAAGKALVGELLQLLCNFIGEAMTVRLLQASWPDLAIAEELSLGTLHDTAR